MIERGYSISLEALRSMLAVPLDAQSEKSELNYGDETRTMIWLRLQDMVETIGKEDFADAIFTDAIRKALQDLRQRMDVKTVEFSRGLRADLIGMIELLECKQKKEEILRKEKEEKEERLRKEEKEEKEERLRKEEKEKEERRFTAILVTVIITVVAVSIGIAIKF
jgi:hypothetical protein